MLIIFINRVINYAPPIRVGLRKISIPLLVRGSPSEALMVVGALLKELESIVGLTSCLAPARILQIRGILNEKNWHVVIFVVTAPIGIYVYRSTNPYV